MKTLLLKVVAGGMLVGILVLPSTGMLAEGSYKESTGYLPEFDASESFKVLDQSFRKTTPLIKAFEQGSKKLDKILREYKANPTIEKEAELERQLAVYVSRVVELIQEFSGDRDEIIWALKDLERSVGKFKERLAVRKTESDTTIANGQKNLNDLQKKLSYLARKIKSNPENKALRSQFRKELRNLRFQERYLNGYRNNRKALESWSGSLDEMHKSVALVQARVADLLDSLDQEKEILASAIGLRDERVQVVSELSKGFVGKGAILRELTDKIKLLYEGLNKFSQVTEEMDVNLGSGSAVNRAVIDIADSIKKSGPVPLANDRQLNMEIDFYADR